MRLCPSDSLIHWVQPKIFQQQHELELCSHHAEVLARAFEPFRSLLLLIVLQFVHLLQMTLGVVYVISYSTLQSPLLIHPNHRR